MHLIPSSELVASRYREAFGATVRPGFANWLQVTDGAALGYRRANSGSLFLEGYLDQPVEAAVGEVLGRAIDRSAIVEIGNFAATNALAMIELWGSAANDLGAASEIAVATLTAPLRRMFERIGLPITAICPARPERLSGDLAEWGGYYELDPVVCMGVIADGQAAIAAFLARRSNRAEA